MGLFLSIVDTFNSFRRMWTYPSYFMKSPLQILRTSPGFFAASLAGLALLAQSHAPDTSPEDPTLHPVAGAEIGAKIAQAAESHPAVEALTNNLKASISNNHLEAVRYIEPTSIETYKFRTLNAVRTQLDAVTLEGSKRTRLQDILNELGFDSMEQMCELPEARTLLPAGDPVES